MQAWALIDGQWIEMNDQIWWDSGDLVRVSADDNQDEAMFYVWVD